MQHSYSETFNTLNLSISYNFNISFDYFFNNIIRRDCCDPSPISKLFDNWCSVENPTQIRLDVFHWMRRLEAGIYTQAHPLHPIFMTKLSEAIFEINSDDLDNLRKAKLSELHKDGKNVSATAVDKYV